MAPIKVCQARLPRVQEGEAPLSPPPKARGRGAGLYRCAARIGANALGLAPENGTGPVEDDAGAATGGAKLLPAAAAAGAAVTPTKSVVVSAWWSPLSQMVASATA